MVPKMLFLLLLVPLALGSPMEMMNFMKMMEEFKKKGGDLMTGGGKHYPDDPDGCKAEDFNKDWKEDWVKFQMYQKQKREAEEEEKQQKMEKMKELYEMYQEKKKREEQEDAIKNLIEEFEGTKHKFAFKITYAFVQLCQCSELSAQMDKMMMMENNGTMDGMGGGMGGMSDGTSGNNNGTWTQEQMQMYAMKLSKMEPEEQKKVFMGGLIKSMCHGARAFISHAKQFEEMYMKKD